MSESVERSETSRARIRRLFHDVIAIVSQRLIELAEMIKRLALVLRPESIPVWLQRPILALDDKKPIELIARGEYRRVAKLIAEIEYPGVS